MQDKIVKLKIISPAIQIVAIVAVAENVRKVQFSISFL